MFYWVDSGSEINTDAPKDNHGVEFVAVAFSKNTYMDDGSIYEGYNKTDSYDGYLIPIKRAEEPFDIANVASLGIPGLFRHYIFSCKIGFGSYRTKMSLGQAAKTPTHIYERFGLKHVIEVSHTDSESGQKLFLNDIFKELAGVRVEEPA